MTKIDPSTCFTNDLLQLCSSFITEFSDKFQFTSDQVNSLKELFTRVSVELDAPLISTKDQLVYLSVCRVVSRDKSLISLISSESFINKLLSASGIRYYAEQNLSEIVNIDESVTFEVVVEAQKCLCNLIYNSPSVQQQCSSNGCCDGLIQRAKLYSCPDGGGVPQTVKYFDLRLLFLITALVPSTSCYRLNRATLASKGGINVLFDLLDKISRRADVSTIVEYSASGSIQDKSDCRRLTKSDVELCCEALKVLFNLTVDCRNAAEADKAAFDRQMNILGRLLSCEVEVGCVDELRSDTINMLINMPQFCYATLFPHNPESSNVCDTKEPMEVPSTSQDGTAMRYDFEGHNMIVAEVLMAFLSGRLESVCDRIYALEVISYFVRQTGPGVRERLSPILQLLSEMSRRCRPLRKYLKLKILPPLTELEIRKLPEEGCKTRNRLCKLLTSPNTSIKELVADLLFVICKEKVSRMIKYTGWGNAAGMLASRGLLAGGRGSGQYSDSSDSETDEYEAAKPNINPVTGRLEETRSDPFEGMSDEQKQYEAINLVNMIDRLQRTGVIQPSTIGEDGKPHPVEHVVQLQSHVTDPPSIIRRGHNESDSDEVD